jgi:hypothetical protein
MIVEGDIAKRNELQAANQREEYMYTGENVKLSSMSAMRVADRLMVDRNESNCKPGQFIEFVSGEGLGYKCTPCFPGTYSGDGNSVHACTSYCTKRGYSTYFGATSNSICESRYVLMEGKTCAGSKDTNNEKSNGGIKNWPWKNQGYAYVTSVEECEAAAAQLQTVNFDAITVRTVEERCGDRNLLTGNNRDRNTSLVCEQIMEAQGGTCWGTTFDNANGQFPINVDCRGTCSKCGNGESQICTKGTSSAKNAPVGYCVLITHPPPPARFDETSDPKLTSIAKKGQQELMFFDACTANYFNLDDEEYQAICKTVECPINEQVLGEGAIAIEPGTAPQQGDNAVCESNQEMLALKAELETQQYLFVLYGILAIGIILYLQVCLMWCCGSHSPSYEAYKDLWKETSTTSTETGRFMKLWHSQGFHDVQQASYAWFKISDLVSDWGFWAISVQSLNFQWELGQRRLTISWSFFSAVCLSITIVGTILLVFDLKVLGLRHSEKMRMREDAELGMMKKTAEASDSRLWYVPLIIIIFEDVPQMVSAFLFLHCVMHLVLVHLVLMVAV